MKRRHWITSASAVVIGSLSGCLGMLNNEKITNESKTDSPDAGTTANQTDTDRSSFVRHPDGNAEMTFKVEHVPGFATPEQYKITVELSHVKLTHAGKEGGVIYNIDETITFRKRASEDSRTDYTLSQGTNNADSYSEDTVTLVEQKEIPVSSYEHLRLFGSVISASTSDEKTVRLVGQDLIEWDIGSVYEEGDHKEYIGTVRVNEVNQGYELSIGGMKTLTW